MSKDEEYQEIIDVPEESEKTSIVKHSATIQDIDFFQKYSPEQVLKHFEQKSNVMLGIRELAIKLTKNDWIDYKGVPYLESKGVERLIATFNITLEIGNQRKINSSDTEGDYYMWSVNVAGNGFGVRVEGAGVASQRDSFFSMVKGKRKPSNEIKENHVLQKAITNGKNKVITSLFGLKGLTWNELKKAGISAHTTVNFDGKEATSHKGNKTPPAPPKNQAPANGNFPDKKEIDRFKQTVIDHFGDESAADNWLYDTAKGLNAKLELNGFEMIANFKSGLLEDLIEKYEEMSGNKYGAKNGNEDRY
jgi:hypothetical protein